MASVNNTQKLSLFVTPSIKEGILKLKELGGKKPRIVRLIEHKRGLSVKVYLDLWLKSVGKNYVQYKELLDLSEEIKELESLGPAFKSGTKDLVRKIELYLSNLSSLEEAHSAYQMKKTKIPAALATLPLPSQILRNLEQAKSGLPLEMLSKVEKVGFDKASSALIFEKSEYIDISSKIKKLEIEIKIEEEKARANQIEQLKVLYAKAKSSKDQYLGLFKKHNLPFNDTGKSIIKQAHSLKVLLGKEAAVSLCLEYFENYRRHSLLVENIEKVEQIKRRLLEVNCNVPIAEATELVDIQKCLNAYSQTGLMAAYVRNSSGATKLVKELFGSDIEVSDACARLRLIIQLKEVINGLESNVILSELRKMKMSVPQINQTIQQLTDIKKTCDDEFPVPPRDPGVYAGWIKAADDIEELKKQFDESGTELLKAIGWTVFTEDNIMGGIDKTRGILVNPSQLTYLPDTGSESLKAELVIEQHKKAVFLKNSILVQILGEDAFEKIEEIYKLSALFDSVKAAQIPKDVLNALFSEGNLEQLASIEAIKQEILSQKAVVVQYHNELSSLIPLPHLKEGIPVVKGELSSLVSILTRSESLFERKSELETSLKNKDFSQFEIYEEISNLSENLKDFKLNAKSVTSFIEDARFQAMSHLADTVFVLAHQINVSELGCEFIEIEAKKEKLEIAEPVESNLEKLIKAEESSSKEVEILNFEPQAPVESLDDLFQDVALGVPTVRPSQESSSVLSFEDEKSQTSSENIVAEESLDLLEFEINAKTVIDLPATASEASPLSIPESSDSLFSDVASPETEIANKAQSSRIKDYLSRHSAHKNAIKDWKSGNRGGR